MVARFTAEQVPAVAWEAGMQRSSLRAFVHVSTARWDEIDTRALTPLLKDRDKPDRAPKLWPKNGPRGWGPRLKSAASMQKWPLAPHVGLELGMHSFQPEQPRITLTRSYGDCKDKATLLIALARSATRPT